ncbi:hypothetical protein C8R42DRAFT_640232 [Lentinula raphanica]|nr:hypothetical protein C8R42DRAFT_640232 [Lentinula raphanica]
MSMKHNGKRSSVNDAVEEMNTRESRERGTGTEKRGRGQREWISFSTQNREIDNSYVIHLSDNVGFDDDEEPFVLTVHEEYRTGRDFTPSSKTRADYLLRFQPYPYPQSCIADGLRLGVKSIIESPFPSPSIHPTNSRGLCACSSAKESTARMTRELGRNVDEDNDGNLGGMAGVAENSEEGLNDVGDEVEHRLLEFANRTTSRSIT